MAWLGRFDDFNVGTGESVKCEKRRGSEGRWPGPGQAGSEGGYSRIGEIANKMITVNVVGLIIWKESPKAVISKKGNGSERHLLSLTVCDAPLCFVNVTCWGSREFVNFLASELNIGDVGNSFHLSLSDNQGSLVPYTGLDSSEYISLLHTPTRASSDFYTLEDIQANGMSLQGEHINILAALKKVWPVREIVTKSGKKTRKVDIVVCDETCQSFQLTLWDNFVCLADTWVVMETVIFAADVRITFNEFHSTMVASTSSKTMLTVDPDTPEAHSLRQCVINQNPYMSTENVCADIKDPDIESITNIVTVKGAKALQTDVSSTGQPAYAVVFAFLSHFDVDGDVRTVLKDVCSRCRRRVFENSGNMCTNSDCVGVDLSHDDITDVEYSVTVSLSDHTGSLEFCSLLPSIAEHIFGCKANDFQNLAGLERTSIKWNYLLERIRAVVKIKRAENRTDGRCFLRILSLDKASPVQLLEQGFTSS